MSSVLKAEVVGGWLKFNAPLEGRVRWLYLDVLGLPTTGEGNLLATPEASVALHWIHPDGTAASGDEIRAEYAEVKAMAPGMLAPRYRTARGLLLSDASIDALCLSRLEANAVAIACIFLDFADWPWQAQCASMSMAWAMGIGPRFPEGFSAWSAAARAQDWATCAAECSISTVGNPGVARRNDANVALFKAAAGA